MVTPVVFDKPLAQDIKRATQITLGGAPPRARRRRPGRVPPGSVRLVKHSSNVSKDASADFTVYEDIDTARTWVSTGETITVEVELGAYTANKKGYAKMIAGRWRLQNAECG